MHMPIPIAGSAGQSCVCVWGGGGGGREKQHEFAYYSQHWQSEPGCVCAEFVSQQLCLPFPLRINVHGLH